MFGPTGKVSNDRILSEWPVIIRLEEHIFVFEGCIVVLQGIWGFRI